MLLFGHAGVTLGVAAVLAGGVNRRKEKTDWFVALSKYVDIRWLLVGLLLLDIIDKPVGQYLFRDTFNNGRIFSHTLLFLVVIAAPGLYLWKSRRRTWLLALAAGTFTHLLLDGMWSIPATLFWPLMGFSFPKIDLENWVGGIFHALTHDPSIYIPEIIGLAVALWFAVDIIKRKKVLAFIKYGRIS